MALYKMVINKKFRFDPSDTFTTTYELDSVDELSASTGKALIEAVADAERNVLTTQVEFVSGVISTWEPDSEPYNPDNLIPKALSGTGLRVSTIADMFDTNYCLKLTREPEKGKLGVINLRGALADPDVETEGGKFRLDPDSQLNITGLDLQNYIIALKEAFEAAAVTHVMAGQPMTGWLYPATPEGEKQIPVKQYGPVQVRPVIDINTPRVGPLQGEQK